MPSLNAPRTVGPKNIINTPAAIPTSLTAVTTSDTWLLGLTAKNTGGADTTVTIQNAAGLSIDSFPITAGQLVIIEHTYPPRYVGGLSWIAGAAGVNADLVITTKVT